MQTTQNVKFPKYEQLSYEQKSVSALNFDSNNIIIGAPGTGKTIVALHRMNYLYENGYKNCIMLVYNRPLMYYLRTVVKEMGWDDRFEIYTINDWVYYKLYSGSKENPVAGGIKNKPVPNIDEKENKYKINWDEVNNDFKNEDEKLYEHIVIDEGQDIDINFYKFIVKISSNVTIFLDPNQSLFEDPVTLPDLLKIVNKQSYYTLTLNYRNSKNIADYTRRYAVDKSIFAESYKDGEELEILNCADDINIIFENILNIVKKYDNDKDIGIIVPSEKNQNEEEKRKYSNAIYDYLKNNLDNNYKVTIYWNEAVNENANDNVNGRENVNFEEKSIKIFNYYTVRGIDFDVVILLDKMSSNMNEEDGETKLKKYKNRLYVASTRAKLKLYIIPIYSSEENDHKILDNDLNYSKFPIISNMSGIDCYNKAIECCEQKKYEEAMYYIHYGICIVGIDENIDVQIEAMRKMAFLCDKFNKSDFAIGIISNFAEKNKIYNDPKLIYYYQKCFIDSYNSDAIYENPEMFFKYFKMINDDVDKNDLIDKYYTKYLSKCESNNQTPDIDFAKKFIDKYNLANTNAYKKFRNNIESFNKNNDNNVENNNKDIIDSELWRDISEIKGHDLLDGSYILVIAASNVSSEECLKRAAYYGYVERDFKFYLDYKKMTNIDYAIEKYKEQPKAIIIGAMPHSVKNLGDFESLYGKLINEPYGYPKTFKVSSAKPMSISSFERVLEEVDNYLRKCRYDDCIY